MGDLERRFGSVASGGGGGSAASTTFTPAGNLAATDVQAALVELDGDLSKVVANAQAGAYTLVLADAGKAVDVTSASAVAVTVPPNSSVAFALGTVVEIAQLGAGQLTITAGAGVTLRSSGAKLKTTGQYSAASIRKIATNEWLVTGDLVA